MSEQRDTCYCTEDHERWTAESGWPTHYCGACQCELWESGDTHGVCRMVPAQPTEAVRETRLYRLLRDMAGVDALALAEKDGGWELAGLGLAAGDVVEDAPPRTGWDGEYIDALVHAEFSITDDGRAILATLDAAPDAEAARYKAALEWLAERHAVALDFTLFGCKRCPLWRCESTGEFCAAGYGATTGPRDCGNAIAAAALAAASAPDTQAPTGGRRCN